MSARGKKTHQSKSTPAKTQFFIAAFAGVAIVSGITAGILLDKNRVIESDRTSASNLQTGESEPEDRGGGRMAVCINFAIDEFSGTDSQLVKFAWPPTAVNLIKTYPCSGGICDVESMDSDNAGQLYLISNTKKALYKVNKSTGSLTLAANLNPAYSIISMAFRKSDNSLWVWAPNKGLYTLNPATGALTLRFASSLSYVDGLAWDNNSQYLYMSRTDGGQCNSTCSNAKLLRYSPSDGLDNSYVAQLPWDTDGIDFGKDGLLQGGYHGGSGAVKVYSFNVSTKSVVKTYTISTPYRNFDAYAACVTS